MISISFIKRTGKILIQKEYCWLDTKSIILPGVKLGDNFIVKVGSLVTNLFRNNEAIGDMHAKIIIY
jgi:acetyltransferase-like isoleucine patch superfamily enzyme